MIWDGMKHARYHLSFGQNFALSLFGKKFLSLSSTWPCHKIQLAHQEKEPQIRSHMFQLKTKRQEEKNTSRPNQTKQAFGLCLAY